MSYSHRNFSRKNCRTRLGFEGLESRHLLSAVHAFADFIPPQTSGELDWWHRQTDADEVINDQWSGSRSTVVAVIDDGVDYANTELADRIWINQGEIPSAFTDGTPSVDGQGVSHDDDLEDVDDDGFITFADLNHAANSAKEDVNGVPLTSKGEGIPGVVDAADLLRTGSPWLNGIDDDAASVVVDLDGDGDIDETRDDLFGWNFSTVAYDDTDGSVTTPNDPSPGGHDPLPNSGDSHGTSVSRIIAAEAGDGGDIGFAPRVSILPIKVHVDADTNDLSHQWMSALEYLTALKNTTNIAVVNVSLRISSRQDPESDAALIRSDQANQAVNNLVAADVGYVDTAGNGNEEFSDYDVGFFPDHEDLTNGFDEVSGSWSSGGQGEHDFEHDIARFLQSSGAIIVSATEENNVALPGDPAALWFTNQGLASNFGVTQSPDEFAQRIINDINDVGDEDFALPATGQLDFVKTHYPPDGPIDSDLTGHDTNWTIHGSDIAAPGENILGNFSGTSAAAPIVSASVALLRSLVPELPITSRQDISTRLDATGCAASNLGVVEHIICQATNVPALAGLVDGVDSSSGRFLNVKNAIDAAHAANPVTGGDLNRDGVTDARDIDLMWGAAHFYGDNPSNIESTFILDIFDLDGDNVVEYGLDTVNGDTFVTGDIAFLVVTTMQTVFGDSNLDGVFNPSDFVTVFQAGEYEDDVDGNSGWADGDWNGDSDYNTNDLVYVFTLDDYTP